MKPNREIKQFLFVAKHYLSLALRLKRKLIKSVLNLSIKEWKYICKKTVNYNEIKKIFIYTSHLGSCAMRLEVIENIMESYEYKRYYQLRKEKDIAIIQSEFEKYRNRFRFMST